MTDMVRPLLHNCADTTEILISSQNFPARIINQRCTQYIDIEIMTSTDYSIKEELGHPGTQLGGER